MSDISFTTMKDLERLKGYLRYYNNQKMPDKIQKQITANWNRLSLYRYNNYGATTINLKLTK